jgi:hypothetical protein
MNKGNRFLDISNWIFWIILGLILFMLLPYFKNGFYNDEPIKKWVTQFDTIREIQPPITDTVTTNENEKFDVFTWRDFNGKWHTIKFKYPKDALKLAERNRLGGMRNHSIYERMYTYDRKFLKDLIRQMKGYIKKKDMDYLEALNYVCSSIQYFKYTLINTSDEPCPSQESFGNYDEDCSCKTGRGCCTGVDPFAVYSPFEFIHKKTGDCDTRALAAFTILKEMGFDVAVMVSKSQKHSVLGVVIPGYMNSSYSRGRNYYGKTFLLWELTSENWRLGMKIEGKDWVTALE